MAQLRTETVQYELVFNKTTIGRGRLTDIRIADPGEPPVHCTIAATGENTYELRNLSPNGTILNGRLLTGSAELRDGDVFYAGSTRFIFAAVGAAQQRAVPKPGVVSGAMNLLVGTFVSRILGFLREAIVGYYFGLSAAADAFFVASTIPNLFRGILGEQALESAFMPTFQSYLAHGKEKDAWRIAATVFNAVLIALVVLSILTAIFTPQLMYVMAPGFRLKSDTKTFHLAVKLALIMTPFMVFIGLAAFLGSVLLALRKFTLYSIAPSCFSIGAILGIVFLHRSLWIYSAAVGLVVGGLLEFVVQIPGVPFRRGGVFQRVLDHTHPGARRVLAISIPIWLAAAVGRVSTIVDRALATLLPNVGSVAALNYSFRLIQLPQAIVGLAIGRAAYPALVESNALRQRDKFQAALNKGIRLNFLLVVPITVITIVCSDWIVKLVYQRGAFTAGDTKMTAIALSYYAVGLLGMTLSSVFYRAFYAILDARTPLKVTILAALLGMSLKWCLMHTPLQHAGLALSTSVSSLYEALLLYLILAKRMKETEG